MYGCLAYKYLCVTCMHSTYESQNGVLDPLELKLQMVVSYHMGIEPKSFGRADSVLKH